MAKLKLTDKRKVAIKQGAQPKTKDEKIYLKKVEAGRARAKNSLKDSKGKYLSKAQVEQVYSIAATKLKGVDNLNPPRKNGVIVRKKFEEVAREAKLTKKELSDFWNTNKEGLMQSGIHAKKSMSESELIEAIMRYNGKIILNGVEVTKAAALKKLADFKQLLSTELTATDFFISPRWFLKGVVQFSLPDISGLPEALEGEDFEDSKAEMDFIYDWLNDGGRDEDDIYIIRSPEKEAA